jgi:serine/threonine protein phosphatase PrpC
VCFLWAAAIFQAPAIKGQPSRKRDRSPRRRKRVKAGDVVLLCSDGLAEMVPDARMAAILQEEREPRRACERLVAEANDLGGKDNITVIVARFDEA